MKWKKYSQNVWVLEEIRYWQVTSNNISQLLNALNIECILNTFESTPSPDTVGNFLAQAQIRISLHSKTWTPLKTLPLNIQIQSKRQSKGLCLYVFKNFAWHANKLEVIEVWWACFVSEPVLLSFLKQL